MHSWKWEASPGGFLPSPFPKVNGYPGYVSTAMLLRALLS